MLTDEQRSQLSRMSIVDVIDYYTVPRILQYIDCLHAVVIYGLDEIFKALEKYSKHKE